LGLISLQHGRSEEKIYETKLSKLVVFENNIDHIKGYIHQLDLFKNPDHIGFVLLPIPAVPESMSASDLISKFTKERKSIAWVVENLAAQPASLRWKMYWKNCLEKYRTNTIRKSL
jgi:CBS domain containing-hemolysin-like protein